MNAKPFFSVIVPIYNRQNSILKCIQSILNQSFIDFELILVDDGSTDQSENICKQFITDPRTIYIKHKTNMGVVTARDTGIKNSRGKYITWVDSDDFIDKQRLQTFYETIIRENVDIVITGYMHEFQNGKKKLFSDAYNPGVYKQKSYEQLKPHIFEFNSKTGMRNIHTILWNKAIKKELLELSYKKIPSSITIGDDTPRTYIALLAADSVAFITDYSYHYIENASQMMKAQYQKTYFENSLSIYQLIDSVNKEYQLTSQDIRYEISQNIAITAVFAILDLREERNKEIKKDLISQICNNKILRSHLTEKLVKKQRYYFRILLSPIYHKNYWLIIILIFIYSKIEKFL